jgi:hypothetical protein
MEVRLDFPYFRFYQGGRKLKTKSALITLSCCLFITTGCIPDKEKEVVKPVAAENETDLPGFVKEADFEGIDWDKTVTKIGSNGTSDILGNPDKVGYIGPALQAQHAEKWLWHFFGETEGKLAVVAYHHETSEKASVLTTGYTTTFSGGALYGADATMPSNVSLPKAGKWALLVYIDEVLFDTLVLEAGEK